VIPTERSDDMIPDDVKYLLDDFFSEDRTLWYTEDYQRVKDWLDSQPTMPQALWEEAPEWAMWWAVCYDGEQRWYEHKPELDSYYCSWMNTKDNDKWAWDIEVDLMLGIDWRQTLQRRPEAEE